MTRNDLVLLNSVAQTVSQCCSSFQYGMLITLVQASVDDVPTRRGRRTDQRHDTIVHILRTRQGSLSSRLLHFVILISQNKYYKMISRVAALSLTVLVDHYDTSAGLRGQDICRVDPNVRATYITRHAPSTHPDNGVVTSRSYRSRQFDTCVKRVKKGVQSSGRPVQPDTISTSLGTHMLQLMREGCSYIYPPLSIDRYSFIQLSELEQCRAKKTCPMF